MNRSRTAEPSATCSSPTTDLAASIAFYDAVLGWRGEADVRQLRGARADRPVDHRPGARPTAGPVLWFAVDDLYPTLARVSENGGTVRGAPVLDQGERWLVEVDDPSGNRLGLVAPAPTARSQTMLMVRDVEASSRWYQELLGLESDHGGPDYERLLADGELVLQLHHEDTDHHHGPIGDVGQARGNGVLALVRRRQRLRRRRSSVPTELGADVVKAPHRNPPEGEGNGPGHREIWVRDPDGYVVVGGQPRWRGVGVT